MQNKNVIIFVLGFVILMGILGSILIPSFKKDPTENELRIIELKKQDSLKSLVIDSLKIEVAQRDSEIEYKSLNPKIVTEFYEKKISDVKRLDTDESIEYIAKRLSQEDSIRQ
jgi:hypothetical protein